MGKVRAEEFEVEEARESAVVEEAEFIPLRYSPEEEEKIFGRSLNSAERKAQATGHGKFLQKYARVPLPPLSKEEAEAVRQARRA